MPDWLSASQRSHNMSSIRSKGNATTEQRLASLLRAERIHGWRRHAALPGRPDFAFREARLAVFVDGCFWHGCPRCFRLPQDNRRYWKAKVLSNRRRDRRRNRQLRRKGWRVLRVWEHSLEKPRGLALVAARLRSALAVLREAKPRGRREMP
jgi:DNA mismatch endonuclease (patch repair protein)